MIDFNGLMQGIEWEKEVKIGSTIYVPITGKLSEVRDIDVVLDGDDLQGWGVGYGEQAIYLSLGWSEPMEENGNELSQVQRVQNIIPDQRIE